MKKIVLTALLLTLSFGTFAQDDVEEKDYTTNVATLNSIIESLYTVISGDKGFKRDWDLFKHLFHKNAKLIPTGKSIKGEIKVRYLSVDDYISTSGEWLETNGFHEREVHRTVESFGAITQVFSTYEAYKTKTNEVPFLKGINSIQLFNDGTRWWIINLLWTQETEDTPIPETYLPQED